MTGELSETPTKAVKASLVFDYRRVRKGISQSEYPEMRPREQIVHSKSESKALPRYKLPSLAEYKNFIYIHPLRRDSRTSYFESCDILYFSFSLITYIIYIYMQLPFKMLTLSTQSPTIFLFQ
jgi:hypothetical protein